MTLPGGNTPNTTEQIGRDFRLDDTTVPASDYYLTMQHAGEMKNAFDLTYPTPAAPNPAPTPISITIKDPSPNTPPTVIDANEKHFAGSSSTGQDFDINLTDLSATPTPTANQGSDGTANSLNTLKSNAAFSTPTGWQMTLPAANGTLPARRIASLKASNVTTTWLPLHVPLTVSVGVLSNPGANFLNIPAFGSPPPLTIGSSFSWNGSNPPPTYDPTIQGYWEDVGVLQPTPTPVAGQTPQSFAADTTVGEPFYQIPNPSNPNGRLQAHLQWMSRKLSTTWLPINDNAIGFMRDPAETLWPTGVLPGYRLGYFKIERALSGLTPFQANQNFAGNTPGVSYPEQALSYTVQATIMAQEGSWFVIPMPLVPRFDVNGDGNTTDAQDLAAATRFRRLNYQVFVLGNIAQNHSPTTDADYDLEQDPDGRPEGAMRLWVDSLSYPHDIDSAGNGQNWRTITYAADPIPANNNLYLPVTPDIAYTG
ncbi:MAG: hypothetical protein JOZ57_18630 [Abitibacteriaceae bacterium]|nr:hypothetical protein [Abditibacteriaceae bacterium]